MGSKSKFKRSIKLEGIGKELVLSKATAIKKVQRGMIHLDELPDGTWRLTYTEVTVPDWSKIEALKMVRENDQLA